ncbi:MAG TPA: M28 family metallopeptidase [Actinophytocola sp.]|uniref:M28 family metallopeptidase n=1 Tax=Actinophytocola sp. TaxID=1872138 RepID=UPI002DDDAD23|nr:M28 family metallopeptidase [Actinophytocola sp.]HEV2777916.1 M28 family metallopeptidase [Actinophytocola sp.]
MPSASTTRRTVVALAAVAAGLAFTSTPASPAPQAATDLPDGPALARNLVRKVTVSAINRHLIALQRFTDRNGGNRAAGTNGHVESAEYVAGKLEAAGFVVTRQEFPFTFDQTLAQSLSVAGTAVPISRMTYSPSTPTGGITAPLAVVPVDDTPGCEASDYTGVDVTGKIALIKRGGCTFLLKSQLAADAGAVGAVIYNNVPGALAGTLGDPAAVRIPTGGITLADGEALATRNGAATTLELRGTTEPRTTYNVIAETQTGRHDNVVMAGAHLDSVTAGGGINDNGSGSAALLETALQLGSSPRVNNALRFAWWGAEELGLIGSNFYVDSLDFEEQLNIALYLNFDMIASPNAAYFVYDGDNSDGVGAGPGPFGSAQIESAFVEFLDAAGIPTEGTDFTGRSDYGRFIAVGIPAGGLFTGAEGIKTPAQADKWGGAANVAYDPCYHAACDNLGNLDRVALDRNADAMAWVAASYGISTEDVNGIPPDASAATVAKSKANASKARFTSLMRTMSADATATAAHAPHAFCDHVVAE